MGKAHSVNSAQHELVRPTAASDDIESFLDEVFERAVEAIQRGDPVGPSDFVVPDSELRGQVDQLILAAQRVVMRDTIKTAARQEVPGYRLIGELGRGGMGVVYKGQQASVGNREVAIKVLPEGALRGSGVTRFAQECRAIARLKHPSIIAIHDVIASPDGPAAIAMELIDGPSLSRLITRLSLSAGDPAAQLERLERGRSSASAPRQMETVREALGAPPGASLLQGGSYAAFVCRLGAALARALDTVHGAGLVHRDVKPGNVLLRRDGIPVLTDFGLVRDLSSAPDATMHTETGAFVGTAAYAPPEQVRGEHDKVDARSDIYSLGATLFHALTLRALPARSAAEALRFFERGRCLPRLRQIDPRLPRDLETVISTATEPDPARRYQTASDFADDLERVLDLRPIHARAIGPLGRAWRAAVRNRASVIGVVAGAAGAILVSIAFVIYLFVLPTLIAQHLAAARTALINPRYGELVYVDLTKLKDTTLVPDQIGGAIARYNDALREYDRAALAATGRGIGAEIRLERDTVRAACLVLSQHGTAEAMPASLGSRAPRTLDAARFWLDTPGRGLGDDILANTTPIDLRSLGLLSYLCLDSRDAIRAWDRSGYDMADPPDPLVNAAAGQLYLVTGEWARATLRLERAHALLPASKTVAVSLALTALKSNEIGLAQRVVDDIEAWDRKDSPGDIMLCLKAGVLARRDGPGDYDQACALFDQYISRHKAPGGYLDYAQARLAHNDPVGAMDVYRRLALARPEDSVSQGQFIRGVRRCWAALDDSGRAALVRGSDLYVQVWEMYSRILHDYTQAQLRDPSEVADAAQVELLPQLEAPASLPR